MRKLLKDLETRQAMVNFAINSLMDSMRPKIRMYIFSKKEWKNWLNSIKKKMNQTLKNKS